MADARAAIREATLADVEAMGRVVEIVGAYLRKNALPADQIPALIASVYIALERGDEPPKTEEPRKPAVPVSRSVGADGIICLDCGWKGQMLKRHIATSHGLTEQQYRERWRLPPSYSIVAPGYAARRSALAKAVGLGRRGSIAKTTAEDAENVGAAPASEV